MSLSDRERPGAFWVFAVLSRQQRLVIHIPLINESARGSSINSQVHRTRKLTGHSDFHSSDKPNPD